MSRRLLFVFVLFALTVVGGEPRPLQTQVAFWPRWDARYIIEVYKVSGKEPTDVNWLHLHQGEPDATSVTLGVNIIEDVNPDPLTNYSDIQIRYMVHGQPVSDWLSQPFIFTLQVANSALPSQDGFHDVSVDVQGARRMDFKPTPIILHLSRGRGVSPLVPILNLDCEYCRYPPGLNLFGSGVIYVDWHTRQFKGYPLNPDVKPWHTAPADGDLYQEEMAPHTDLFAAEHMWWEEPQGTMDAGAKFIRAVVPKPVGDFLGEYRYNSGGTTFRGTNADFGFAGLRNLPYKDGPRSVAWTSAYVSGMVDSNGGFVFVEKGGPLRYMDATGTVTTVAGWRVKPDHDPVWVMKPFDDIRANMELRGTWTGPGLYSGVDRGFHAPTDVTIDTRNENVWYVVGMDDQDIWKVVVDRATMSGTVSLLAGSPNHEASYADGVGSAAKFNTPFSIAFNPIDRMLYVTDHMNDAIRRVNPDTGEVTTALGRPGAGARLAASHVPGCYPGDAVPGCFIGSEYGWDSIPWRAVAHVSVTPAEAAAGVKADVYAPMPIRADSRGRLVFIDAGFASMRQFDPTTGAVKLLGNIVGRWERGASAGFIGLAVDRWGNSGPQDGIYWFQSVASTVDGEVEQHTNEVYAWMPPEGGKSVYIVGQDWSPCPDGWGPRACTDPPHYPWMIAVDPRGALYLSGMGEHGITRIRVRRPSDPMPSNWIDYLNAKYDWAIGSIGFSPNGHALAEKFGWEGHNLLGFANLWDAKYQNATDNVLLDDFEIPAEIRNDPVKRARVLNFMRLNAGSGSVTVPAPVPPGPVGDSTPPSVNVVGPVGSVRGARTIDVSASDNVGVVGVQILLDDQALWPEITQPPYRVSWSTPATPDGPHVITAIARDAAGNTAVSAPVSVVVANVRIGFPGPTPASSPWLSQSIEPSVSRVTPVRFPISGNAVVQVDLQVYADRKAFVRIVAGRGPMCDEDRRALTTVQVLGPDAGYRFPVVTVPSGLMPCVESLTLGATVSGLANYIIVR